MYKDVRQSTLQNYDNTFDKLSTKNAQITESQDFYETLYIMFLYTFRSWIQFHNHVEKHKHVIFL